MTPQRWYVVLLVFCFAGSLGEAGPPETFGNFHTMGVILDVPDGSAPEAISGVKLYALDGDESRPLLDPVRVERLNHYVGSVFGLTPGTTYRFRAEFLDQKGKTIHREEFTGSTRPEPDEPPTARQEIHVSTTGDDANAGSKDKPLRTVRAALKKANRAGTHVVIHSGTYYEGGLPAVGRGTPNDPIVIRAAKGANVVLDGSHTPTRQVAWKSLGNGYFSTPYSGKSWLVCVTDSKTKKTRRLYPVGSLAKLKSKKVGRFSFQTYDIREAYFCSGKEITVYLPDYDRETMSLHVGHHASVAEHSRSNHIVYSGLTCRFYQGQVFYVNDSSDMTFRRCRFEYCTLPIAVKRASHRLLVEECHFLDDCTRWGFLPKGMDDVGYSAHIELGAVYVHNPYEGRGLVFRNNVIDGLFDGIHLTPMGPTSKVRTHETDFYGNRIVRVCDDLIEADGQCRNLRIFDNTMANCLSGISLAQGYHGPTFVLYNVVSGVGNSSAVRLPPHYEGYPIKTNGGTRHGTTGKAYFYHNTFSTDVPNTNAFRVQVAKWDKLAFANNIWQGTRDGFVFWRDDISPIEMTNDLVHVKTGPLLKIRKRNYSTKQAAAQRATWFERVLVADPKFVAPDKGDYRLAPASPAIDSGVAIPGVNTHRSRGKAPDIGARESSSGERR